MSSLNYHQKTAKYCLEIQGKEVSNEYKCEYCDKLFSTKYSFNSHIDVCKESKEKDIEKYKNLYENIRTENQTYRILLSERDNAMKSLLLERDNTIKSLEKQIYELNQTIADIAKQPKNTTTNIKTQNNHIYFFICSNKLEVINKNLYLIIL